MRTKSKMNHADCMQTHQKCMSYVHVTPAYLFLTYVYVYVCNIMFLYYAYLSAPVYAQMTFANILPEMHLDMGPSPTCHARNPRATMRVVSVIKQHTTHPT